MPRIRTPAAVTVRYLFNGNKTEAAKRSGITRRTLYNREKNPAKITLSEFGALSQDLTDSEIVEIVREWGKA